MTVEKEAQELYPYGRGMFFSQVHNDDIDRLRAAYIAGSTARSNEAKDFAEWIVANCTFTVSVGYPWQHKGKYYTTEQLFETYKTLHP